MITVSPQVNTQQSTDLKMITPLSPSVEDYNQAEMMCGSLDSGGGGRVRQPYAWSPTTGTIRQ